jgi:glycerol-3-phosphate acyltransferase PlsY
MLAVLLGYLTGSIPFAFLLARLRGVDVRVLGSGNVGATNVMRTTGTGRAIAVMALDLSKGIAAVLVAHALEARTPLVALAGVATIVGHIYPVWLRFHGGKGVAVAAGVFAVLAPVAMIATATLFVSVVSFTKYVSAGSIVATLALPPAVWLSGAPAAFVEAAAAASALILFRHRANVARLLTGTERRMGVRA